MKTKNTIFFVIFTISFLFFLTITIKLGYANSINPTLIPPKCTAFPTWPPNVTPTIPSMLVDPECLQYSLTYVGRPTPPVCDTLCSEDCVNNNLNCLKDYPQVCCDYDLKAFESTGTSGETIKSGLNFFGLDWGPLNEAIPRLFRVFLTGGFGLLALVSIIYGLYGLYTRSMAKDSAEEAEKSTKMYQSAAWGVAISFIGVIIMQIVAVLTGYENNLFSFNLIPKQGEKNILLTQDDIKNGVCLPEQTGVDSAGNTYRCVNDKWVP